MDVNYFSKLKNKNVPRDTGMCESYSEKQNQKTVIAIAAMSGSIQKDQFVVFFYLVFRDAVT